MRNLTKRSTILNPLCTDRDTIIRFQTELITEHMIAQSAAKGKLSEELPPAQNMPVTKAPGNSQTARPVPIKLH